MAAFIILLLSYFIIASLINLYYYLKCFEGFKVQSLDKFIFNYIFYKYINNSNLFKFDIFSNLVILYFNIFSILIKF